MAIAGRLRRFDAVGEALSAGRVSLPQAEAITRSLDELPAAAVTDDELTRAQAVMIDHAARFDPPALRRIGNHLIELICPASVTTNSAGSCPGRSFGPGGTGS